MATVDVAVAASIFETLKKIAVADQIPVEDLIENVLAEYAIMRYTQTDDDELSDEEYEGVMEALQEVEAGKVVTLEEVEAELREMINNYQPDQKKAAS